MAVYGVSLLSKKSRIVTLVAFSSALLPACKSAAPVSRQSQQANDAAVASAPDISMMPASAIAPSVTAADGRVSITADQQSLDRILNAISQQAHVAIIKGTGFEDRTISVSIQNQSLTDGLRTILKDYDAFFLMGGDTGDASPASLKAVWIYPRGVGQTVQPIPLEEAASTRELAKQVNDANPQVRARAIGGLAQRKGNEARDSVMDALHDSDPTVRTQALSGAENGGIDIPPETLKNLATNDPAPEVRFLALDALQGTPEGEAAVESALHDSNPRVRDAANEFLWRLHAAQEPPAPNPQPNPYAQ
jgi:hypothetical protein